MPCHKSDGLAHLNLRNVTSCDRIEERLGPITGKFVGTGASCAKTVANCVPIYESIARMFMKELPAQNSEPIVVRSGLIGENCAVIGAS